MFFTAALDVVAVDAFTRKIGNLVELDHAVFEHARMMRRQQRILGQRHAWYRATAEAFLGHETEAADAALMRIIAARGFAADDDRLGIVDQFLARQRV